MDGWTFHILDPFENNELQNFQDEYLENYKKSYDLFIESLCIPEPEDLLFKDPKDEKCSFLYYISCKDEDDIINKKEYEYKFKKSIFFQYKYNDIKHKLDEYYAKYNINVKKITKQGSDYFIELNR